MSGSVVARSPARLARLAIAALALVSVTACASFENDQRPELAGKTLGPADGAVVLSTGAASPCAQAATHLWIAPVGSKYGSHVVKMLHVDSFVYKSDFSDHQGNISLFVLPAGDYEVYPIHLADQPIRISQFKFSVEAGKLNYAGEYFMPVACRMTTTGSLQDQEARDLSFVRQRNPDLGDLPVARHIAAYDGLIVDRSGRK